VSVGEMSACVRIAGKANCLASPDFQALFEALWRKGYTFFILDLTDCVLMDSTFLGVLASFGLKTHTLQPDKIPRTLELYNPSERITELLENLGVLHLFTLASGATLPENADTCDFVSTNADREKCKRTSLEAHQLLIQINPANADKFKDVVAFLAEDLKKLKAAS